jgi:hypothetical protein
MVKVSRHHQQENGKYVGSAFGRILLSVFVIGGLTVLVSPVGASHQGHGGHVWDDTHDTIGTGYQNQAYRFRYSWPMSPEKILK